MLTDWIKYVAKLPLSATWRGELGTKFMQLVLGEIHNRLDEGFMDAVRSPYLHLPGSTPDDALPFIGSETSINAYPGETLTSYRARLKDPWDTWTPAGDESVITAQFAAAGYPGVEVQFDPAATGPRGEAAPYWSQFWVFFPFSSGHPVTGAGATYNSFNWGDGTLWGLTVQPSFYQLIHFIVRKWKPGHWVCRGFIFELADTSTVEAAFGI
jgi:hypothetical protein